jgi:hypothetical protein
MKLPMRFETALQEALVKVERVHEDRFPIIPNGNGSKLTLGSCLVWVRNGRQPVRKPASVYRLYSHESRLTAYGHNGTQVRRRPESARFRFEARKRNPEIEL